MKNELQPLIDLFLRILHMYSVIERKPKDYGTGDLLYFTEIHTISMIGKNRKVNMTRLAEMMGVTKGAISQTVRKLVHKDLIRKENSTNKKEFSLSLSEKGQVVLKAQESFQQELFDFAARLYERAKPDDRELVLRLFTAISNNMEERVKAL
jgi:DNA-binding MarR family transcriptional regulator